jgi:hypothetical protein
MSRVRLVAGVLLLLGSVAGCGDPPRVVLRDVLTTLNEVADSLLEVDDEDTATKVMTERIEPLKKKFEVVKKRVENFRKFDKDEKKELAETIEPMLPEGMATAKRLKEQADRLTRLRSRLPKKDAPNLSAAIKVADEFQPSYGGSDKKGLKNPLEDLKPVLPKK